MRFKRLNYIYIMKGFMTVAEYATLKEISVQAVYKRIKSKKLEKKKIGNFILVKEITD